MPWSTDGHQDLRSQHGIFLECSPYFWWFSLGLPRIIWVCSSSDKANTADDGNELAMRFHQKVIPGKAQLTTFNGIKSWSQQVNVNSLTHQPSAEIRNSVTQDITADWNDQSVELSICHSLWLSSYDQLIRYPLLHGTTFMLLTQLRWWSHTYFVFWIASLKIQTVGGS